MLGKPAVQRAVLAAFFKCKGYCLTLSLTEEEIKNPALAVVPCVKAANAGFSLYKLLVDALADARAAGGRLTRSPAAHANTSAPRCRAVARTTTTGAQRLCTFRRVTARGLVAGGS